MALSISMNAQAQTTNSRFAAKESLSLTNEWDKTFPTSEKVMHLPKQQQK